MGGQQSTVRRNGFRPATSANDGLSVLLETPLTLLAQAVGSALRSRGVEVEIASGRRGRGSPDPSRVLVVMDDLVTAPDVRRVLSLVGSTSGPLLVLTGREWGHAWGALVSAGATSIMSSTASVDEVVGALAAVRDGDELQPLEERAELLVEWDSFLREQRDAVARLARLTARERAVLEGMAEGISVHDQAALLDVAETTIRSHVKAILRKLGVRSQLAAVAIVHHLQSPLAAGAALTVEPVHQERKARTTSLEP